MRSIDDFLDQLYQEYGQRLPRERSTVWDYRHYFPLPLLALCVANSSDATEILMLSYLLANPTFRQDMFPSDDDEDGGSSASLEGAEYLAASIFLGMLLGGTLLGFASDYIGRRPALIAGLLINAIAGFFSSLPFMTPSITHLTALRFVAGIGIGATVPSLFSLASEWSPKEIRGAVVTFVASFWMVGSLFVSGVAWVLFTWDHQLWRVFAALCALPSALGAVLVYSYVPESPRFLASRKQRFDESAHACNQIASILEVKLVNDGDFGTASGSTEFRAKDDFLEGNCSKQSRRASNTIQPLTEEELRQVHASSMQIGTNRSPTMSARPLRALHTLLETVQRLCSPQLLPRTTLPLNVIWFSLSFSTYGISTWINTLFVQIHLQNIYFNTFLFALSNLPGNIVSIVFSDKYGRKRMLVGSLLGAAGGLAGFAALAYSRNSSEDGSSTARSKFGIVLFACLFQAFSIISWNSIDILTGELFPTSVRSAGMGVCTASGRFGAMFAQFVNARLMMNGDGERASASVLAVAAITLLMAAGMPTFLERDMTLGELKDQVAVATEESVSGNLTLSTVALGCMGKGQKDHLSDEDSDKGYQSLRQESYLL